MAEKKTAGKQKRASTSQKKPQSSKSRSRTASSSGEREKTSAAAKKAQEQQIQEQKRQRNQIRAIILFAGALLAACMVLIPGDHGWYGLHSFFMGMFGTWAILWPILLIYIAVMTAMEKPVGRLRFKIILSAVIIILACSASYIFSDIQTGQNHGYFTVLGELYTTGTTSGGAGLAGGLLGYPFVSLLGAIGSRIAILLILFVALMILTGTTLMQLFRTLAKPAKSVAGSVASHAKERKIAEITPQMTNIDIAVDSGKKRVRRPEPAKKTEEEPAPKFSGPSRTEQPTAGKRDRLLEVFGVKDEAEEPSAAPAQNQKEPEEALSPAAEAAVAAARDAFRTAAEGEGGKSVPSSAPTHPEPEAPFHIPATPTDSYSHGQTPSSAPVTEKAVPNEKETASSLSEIENTGGYVFPPVSMLEPSRTADASLEMEEQQHNGQLLIQTLKSFGVQAKILDICRGPSVTRYEIQPAAGVKISKITNLSDDIAMNLAASGVRIEAPIPGKAAVGIEVPNRHRSVVRMRELIESNAFLTARSKLTVALGRDIAGQVTCADLSKMPHILIAGTTGSGKSVCINSLIVSLLYKSRPEEVRLLMIDPKVVELGIYNGIPHLLVPVVTNPRKASGALSWAVKEMDDRYRIFADCNVRDLASYNKLAEENGFVDEDGQPMPAMPQIVIIIDELADLMMVASNEVEDSICRLAQKARAAGMHLVVATQRPSVDVVTGLIKANIPSRIAFTVSSPVDSRTILDTGGAEKLLGQGDMLFAPVGAQKPVRIQGCYVSDGEIESIVNFVKQTHEEVSYDGKIMEEIEKNAAQEKEHSSDGGEESLQDPMLNEAIRCVVEAGQASTSLLQRRLRLGYARAGRLIDQLEQLGVVGPHEGSKPRQVLMTYQQWLERTAQQPD